MNHKRVFELLYKLEVVANDIKAICRKLTANLEHDHGFIDEEDWGRTVDGEFTGP